jgi:hypothetical protein
MALCDGPLGDMFARPTTERLRLDAPAVCIDISSIKDTDRQLQAAALVASWNDGFGCVEAANALADANVAPQRWSLIVLDELWQVLRDRALVERVDALTRLNRDKGVGQVLISHSGTDMSTGFLERSGAIVCFGLPRRELAALRGVVAFTAEEEEMVSSWSTPPGWSASASAPGTGNCLIKVGERPGVALHVDLVDAERGLNETSRRWTQ